jgi:hypothetical protein
VALDRTVAGTVWLDHIGFARLSPDFNAPSVGGAR